MVPPSSKTYASVTLAAAAAAFASASSRRLARARSASAGARSASNDTRGSSGYGHVAAGNASCALAEAVPSSPGASTRKCTSPTPDAARWNRKSSRPGTANPIASARPTPAPRRTHCPAQISRGEPLGTSERASTCCEKKTLILDSRFIDRRDLRSFRSLRSRALLPLPRSGHGRDRVELVFRQTHRAPLLRAPLIQVRLQRRDAARLQPT